MKQLFKIAKKPATRDEWLVSPGAVTIGDDFLNIGHYPFEPSAAFGQITLHASQMDDLDVTSAPPTIRMGNELIFLTAEKRSELRDFASRNNVTTVERPMIWEWILEPFLDTEYSAETDRRLAGFLENYGLSVEYVQSLRSEVEKAMLRYNFDTLLWEWCSLGACDVLLAMQAYYPREKFGAFYHRAMAVALSPRV